MATIKRNTVYVVTHMRGVKAAVAAEAKQIGARATSLLAEHRHDGDTRVEVNRHKTDTTVDLIDDGKAVVAIEFGHLTSTGEFVPGLNILSRAAGL
ncbi:MULTISPECIES: DUF5403 family protein [unclassified Crossiella]|uniref:DUF5403 family protein n=1 Tax=unclassified Crossiella TaxID=2620835 RepID=UPI001FFE8013|nr:MULTISPECIES: DUF5403 family protein [unclassified Crossiella]MCK2242322.1 DUF5403 family protein [Crossiella sp. S99.2]MCK2254647.1 DUF5403 family protein [Crossiella sp. S99.1]